jgi:hypothetical protein
MIATRGSICIGVCRKHKHRKRFVAVWRMGSANVKNGSKPVVGFNSIARSSCGHTVRALGKASTVKVNGKGVHRHNDISIIVGGVGRTLATSNVFSGA